TLLIQLRQSMYSILLQAAAPQQPSMVSTLLPFVAIIVIFYFFMIRPQMKRQKELRKYRESLKKGDKVITTGGIYGKVVEVKDNHMIVEIANGVEIKIDKAAIIMDMTDAAPRKSSFLAQYLKANAYICVTLAFLFMKYFDKIRFSGLVERI